MGVTCRLEIDMLSPILFILYIADLGHLLENHPGGIQLQGVNIAGLLYVDDLILIGKTPEEVENLLSQVQKLLESLGMSINCSKSNIISCKDAKLKVGVPLLSTNDERLGYISRAPKYKYLGVQVTTDSATGVFKEATKMCKTKLKSQAGIILGMTKHDFDPVLNGLNLWTHMAVSAALYGSEIIKFSQDDIKELDNIQATFLAHLLGQRSSVSHAALRKETGIQTIQQIVTKMKLNYWHHLTTNPHNTWLSAAYRECFPTINKENNKAGWNSSYAKEIKQNMTNIGLSESKIPEKKSQFKKLLKRLTDKYYDNLSAKAIEEQRDHSLRAYPEFIPSSKPQSYLSGVKDRKILTKFRLGDAGLGNRSNAPIKLCPMCKTGENTEPHLVFECPEVQNIRDKMGPSFNLPKYLRGGFVLNVDCRFGPNFCCRL